MICLILILLLGKEYCSSNLITLGYMGYLIGPRILSQGVSALEKSRRGQVITNFLKIK